jgi:DNA-binding NtrC family response regulator
VPLLSEALPEARGSIAPSLAPHAETADECPSGRRAGRAATFLFQLLDCDRPWMGGCRFELAQTDEVTIGRGDARPVIRETVASTRRLALTLPTATLSAKHVRLLRVGDDWAIQDRGSRNGTWLNSRRIDYAELSDKDIFQVGRCFYMFRRYENLAPGHDWPDVTQEPSSEALPSLVTLSPEVTCENQALRSIAKSHIPVLILGCTGTGKELTAKAVHELSARSGRFCAVNCGAIPNNLVESTLFGHVKGAFSGALANQLGVVRAADKGTLFLDEIGDLPLEAQTALLRVLQEGEVLPVGCTQPVKVEVRVVAATHQPLQQLIEEKRFRADLYARLAGYVHQLRPLELRLEDFGVLFSALLRRATGTSAVDITLTTEAGWALLRHPWPLNVRELEQAISRAAVLGNGSALSAAHFPFVLEHMPRSTSGIQLKTPSVDVALRTQLDELMREHCGNVTAVARALGKAPTQIQRWLKRVGLVADGYRG